MSASVLAREHRTAGRAWPSVALLAGCSSIQTGRTAPGQRLDPWENWNRKVFAFNEGLDEKVLKPVATVYSDVVPQPVRNGVGNFFGNVLDAWSAINNMLQGKFAEGFDDVTRVGTNTLFGLFGIVDVASEMGLDHHYEDFGQTLGRWGVGAGAYLVLPVLGPSSLRDAAALPLDRAASPALLINNGSTQAGHHHAADHQHAREPARCDAGDRRHLARQVHVHPRRLPAAAPEPGVRRRRSGNAGTRRTGRRRQRRDAPATGDAASAPSPAAGASAPK